MRNSRENSPSDSNIREKFLRAGLAGSLALSAAIGLGACDEKVNASNEPAPIETTQSEVTPQSTPAETAPTEEPQEEKGPTYAELNKNLIDPNIVSTAAEALRSISQSNPDANDPKTPETDPVRVAQREVLIEFFKNNDQGYNKADGDDEGFYGGFYANAKNKEKIAYNTLSGLNTILQVSGSPEVSADDKIEILTAYKHNFTVGVGGDQSVQGLFDQAINLVTTSDYPNKTPTEFTLLNPFLGGKDEIKDYDAVAGMPRVVAVSTSFYDDFVGIDLSKCSPDLVQEWGTLTAHGTHIIINPINRVRFKDESGNNYDQWMPAGVIDIVVVFDSLNTQQSLTNLSIPRVIDVNDLTETDTVKIDGVETQLSEIL